MGVFEQFPLLTIFVVVIATVLVVSLLRTRRTPGVECRKCGANLPPRAKFCSRCGEKV